VSRNILTVPIHRVAPGSDLLEQDLVAVEEPLQMRVNDRDFAITMRTPGHDRELTAGFLFTEGVVHRAGDIAEIAADDRGTVSVQLAEGIDVDVANRNFYVTSSCGVCGKASIDGLRSAGCPMLPRGIPQIESPLISELPGRLREAQLVFSHTGGLHAAGLFDMKGNLIAVREDVGRHNAVDKLIGAALLDGQIPLHNFILMLSGRISFELVQKAIMAGIPIVAAVGAPSSLAIETALHFGLTLVGFVRGQKYNVYSGEDRLQR
jgi:FdhD protein